MIINNNNSNVNNNVKIPTTRGLSQNKSNNNRYIANSLPDITMGKSISTSKKKIILIRDS